MRALPGEVFGRLTVRAEGPKKTVQAGSGKARRRRTLICDCACGTKNFRVSAQSLLYQGVVSCGCKARERRRLGTKPLRHARKGERFGAWTVIAEKSLRTRPGMRRVQCRCACDFVADVLVKSLITGASRSCGCRRSSV